MGNSFDADNEEVEVQEEIGDAEVGGNNELTGGKIVSIFSGILLLLLFGLNFGEGGCKKNSMLCAILWLFIVFEKEKKREKRLFNILFYLL